jgi:hypothetical protein
MKIRYKTGLGIFILACAAFTLFTTFLTGPSVSTFTGALMLLVGIGYLVRPLAELTETELTVFALFGPVKKQYPAAQLRYVDGRLYSGDKKVRLAAWTANGDDWRALVQKVQGRAAQ